MVKTGKRRIRINQPYTPSAPPNKISRAGKSTAEDTSPRTSRTTGYIPSIIQKARETLQSDGKNDALTAVLSALLVIVEQQQRLLDILLTQSPNNKFTESEDPAEQKERLRSIVVVGLPESSGKPSERGDADHRKLRELFDELDVEAKVSNCYRMGQKSEGRNRLTKVVLATSAQQRTVMTAAKKLKNSAAFKGVFLRPSMTPAQRDEDAKLRKELYERRQKGEFVIIKGWPGQKREIVAVHPAQGN